MTRKRPPAVFNTDYEKRVAAATDLIHRTGATGFQVRYQDDDDPVGWIAVATYRDEAAEAAAALDPLRATLRLGETLLDGGRCTHCQRPTGLEPDSIDQMPMNQLICWYQYDPELATFRRGCEGDTTREQDAAS